MKTTKFVELEKTNHHYHSLCTLHTGSRFLCYVFALHAPPPAKHSATEPPRHPQPHLPYRSKAMAPMEGASRVGFMAVAGDTLALQVMEAPVTSLAGAPCFPVWLPRQGRSKVARKTNPCLCWLFFFFLLLYDMD